jgi:AraC-like DNA-binding protein
MSAAGLVLILFYLIRLSKAIRRYLPLVVFVLLSLIELIVNSVININPEICPHLLYVTEPFAMLYGLLIFYYARNYSNQSLCFKKEDLLFLAPFLLSLLSYLPYYLLSGEVKVEDYIEFGDVQKDVSENIWEWNFEVVLNIAFLLAALKELRIYRFQIKQQLSDIHKVSFELTQLVIKVCILGYLLELIFVYLTFYGFPYYQLLFTIFDVLNYLFLMIIGYEAIVSKKHMDKLLSAWLVPNNSEIEAGGEVIKYAKSTLNTDSIEKISETLKRCMIEKRPFLQVQLRIKDLSDIIGIPTHQLSQVINESFNQNFYEFVNSYRIIEAQKLLADPKFKDYTYTAIGFEVGFNSKSAFYNAFKKFNGVSPAHYKGAQEE